MKTYDEKKYTTRERWLIVVEGCVDPVLYGPYDTDEERLREAREITEEEDCCFSLNIDTEAKPHVWPFTGQEWDD